MVMSRIVLALMAGSLAVAAPMAHAADGDEVVVSNSAATRLPTEAELAKAKADAQAKADATKPVNTQAQVLAWLAGSPSVDHRTSDSTSDYAMQPGDDANAKRKIHGSMGASIGTGGYRSVYATALIPVGDNGTLGIAVSQTDFGKNNVYGYGGYRGYGYGRGYGGYGGYGHRGGTSTSVGLSFATSDDDNLSDPPAGCAPGFYNGGRYIEPVWVSQMHGSAACDTADQP